MSMSEQDKEMEAAAQQHAIKMHGHPDDDRAQAVETTWRAMRSGTIIDFEAGWKAASERKDAEIDRKIEGAMKRAEIDGRLRTYDGAVTELQSKLATALEALEKYATASNNYPEDAREAIARIKGDAK
jgi:hypothetical protein